MKSPPSVLVVLVILGSAAVLLASAAPAGDLGLVQQALEATDGSSIQGWAYTETIVGNDRETVRRFDPRRPEGERWSLVSVDGRPPIESERREEAERRSSDRGLSNAVELLQALVTGSTGDAEGGEISAMIKPGSLSLIEETTTYALYRFEPASDDDDDAKFQRNFDRTLKIVKDGPYVAFVEMRSRGPFKPVFWMKIKEYVTTSTFEPVAAGGPVLPRTVTLRIVMRALLVKEIRATVEVSYGDYEYVGE